MAEEKGTKKPTRIPSVLIIGSNGFLGRTIPPAIAARHPSCKISLLDIRSEGTPGYPYYQADITNLASLVEVFNKVKPAVVVHCASPPIPVGPGDPVLFTRVNVGGTENIIKACQQTGVKALVYTSSASVIYGQGNLKNANETYPYATKHVDVYNTSKVCYSFSGIICIDKLGASR
jgi:sterol-4alpha-carboxylate 3-dehydrogenase (decarboxylating)